MIYKNNEQLQKEYKKLLIDKGIKQTEIANALGLSRQALTNYLNKQHLTFDDISRLLSPIGCKLRFDFVPDENQGDKIGTE